MHPVAAALPCTCAPYLYVSVRNRSAWRQSCILAGVADVACECVLPRSDRAAVEWKVVAEALRVAEELVRTMRPSAGQPLPPSMQARPAPRACAAEPAGLPRRGTARSP